MDLSGYKRIVVKVGSDLLVDSIKDKIKADWMQSVCSDIAQLQERGQDVLIVSSGAIALGRRILKMPFDRNNPEHLRYSQAAAIAGQPSLISAWLQCFATHGIVGGQVLLTKEETRTGSESANNAREALLAFMSHRAIPVINENDAVATAEIKYGDNDQLAAHVAKLVDADLLILLSNVDGMYTADPTQDITATHIPAVDVITPEIKAMAGEPVSNNSSGGMRTKVLAAEIAMDAGCDMIIAKGENLHPVTALTHGALCTVFSSRAVQTPFVPPVQADPAVGITSAIQHVLR